VQRRVRKSRGRRAFMAGIGFDDILTTVSAKPIVCGLKTITLVKVSGGRNIPSEGRPLIF